MLGRTHMAIGAAGVACLAPCLLSRSWVSVSVALHSSWSHISHIFIAQIVLVCAAVAGSLLPDLDQASSTMAHNVERLGQIVMFGLLILVVFMLHQQSSWVVWIGVLFLSWVFGARNNIARRFGLGILLVGLIELGIRHQVDMQGALILAAWLIGTMFTGHRTFTHSILGFGLLTIGLHLAFLHMHHNMKLWNDAVVGVVVGYALHIIADAVAGGVPLLWPARGRIGFRVVRTGGSADHLIGMAFLVVFVVVAVIQ